MDYEKIGLVAGIEIHQQVDGKKLFCDCSTIISDDEPEFSVTRRLRSSAGETGEVDAAAKQEEEKQLTYVYQGRHDTACLIECDSEPPQPMDEGALCATLQMAKMLNAMVVDKVQVMRKTVVDGSNTSGFQRTSLVAMNGVMSTSLGDVTIPTICVEEDACRKIEATGDTVVYSLDRLGIPLIEIATGPDLKSPEHVKEAASQLGMMLRSTGKVRRGLGTIRQDVNVSVKGGVRVEIKGAQDLKMVPTLVEFEAQRQLSLIAIRDELARVGVMVDGNVEKKNVTSVFDGCESKVIQGALSKGGVVYAVKLPGFLGFTGREVQPGRRLGTEFSDRAKIIAGVGGIFHSDELPKYGIEESHVTQLRMELGCGTDDAFILVADMEKKCVRALDAVLSRASECLLGVPQEVRKAKDDGTTSYLRPMPGAARMYPETDVKNIAITDFLLKGIEMPELLDAKSERFVSEYKLSKDLADVIAKAGMGDQFEELVKAHGNVKPAFIAEVLESAPKQLKKEFNVEKEPSFDEFRAVFGYLNSGKLSKESVLGFLKLDGSFDKRLSEFAMMSDEDLEKEISSIASVNKGLPFNALIGKVMGKLRGKADGKKIAMMVKKVCE